MTYKAAVKLSYMETKIKQTKEKKTQLCTVEVECTRTLHFKHFLDVLKKKSGKVISRSDGKSFTEKQQVFEVIFVVFWRVTLVWGALHLNCTKVKKG